MNELLLIEFCFDLLKTKNAKLGQINLDIDLIVP